MEPLLCWYQSSASSYFSSKAFFEDGRRTYKPISLSLIHLCITWTSFFVSISYFPLMILSNKNDALYDLILQLGYLHYFGSCLPKIGVSLLEMAIKTLSTSLLTPFLYIFGPFHLTRMKRAQRAIRIMPLWINCQLSKYFLLVLCQHN